MSRAAADGAKKRNLEGYGLKIKAYRKKAGLSAEELARALGVTVGSVRNWECGLSRPDPESLFRLFSALDVDPNAFFGIRGVGASLSERERGLVGLFRSMDERGRADFFAVGEALAGRCRQIRLRDIRERLVALPDFGRSAAAGAGDEWPQQAEAETVLLYNRPETAGADEIITVTGHSMEPAYHDHDRILVRHCAETRIGQVYVFSLPGQGIVIKEAAKDRLHSRNEEYEDIIPTEEGAGLIGRVLGIIDETMIPTGEEKALYEEAVRQEEGCGHVAGL